MVNYLVLLWRGLMLFALILDLKYLYFFMSDKLTFFSYKKSLSQKAKANLNNCAYFGGILLG